MGRTAVNVAGQALVPTIVAKREGILDLDRFHGARGLDAVDDETDTSERDAKVDLEARQPVTAGR